MALQSALHGAIRRGPLPGPQANAPEGESRLVVGPKIRLKCVEVSDCDTLVIEGTLEATMTARVLRVSERGMFKGSIEVEQAEIRGRVEGQITVREKLVVHGTGQVMGHVRYGKLVIEEGGGVCGEVGTLEAGPAQTQATAGGEGGG